jgi:hypothetical protein
LLSSFLPFITETSPQSQLDLVLTWIEDGGRLDRQGSTSVS